MFVCLFVQLFVVALKIAADDIRWEGEDLGGITERKHLHNGGARAPGAARVRGPPGLQSRSKKEENVGPTQNGIQKKGSDKIYVPNTETIIKEVYFVIFNPTLSNLVFYKTLITAVHWKL